MQWFKNLKIAQKVFGFVILSLVLLCIIGFVGFLNLKNAEQDMANLYYERLLPVSWLNENRSHLRANESSLLWLILSNDRYEQNELIKSINDRAEKYNANMTAYEKIKLSAEEKENVNKLKNSLAKYRVVRKKIIALALDGHQREAYKYFLDNKYIFNDCAKYLIFLAENAQKNAEKVNIQNKQNTAMATTLITFVIIVSIIISLSFGLYLTNMFKRRFANLGYLANQVAGGDLTTVVTIENDDEIGNTAKAVMNIAVNLRKMMKEVAQSAEDLSSSSEEMTAATEQTSQGAQQVAKSVEQLAEGSQHIAQNINQLATGSQQIARKISELAAGTQEQTKNVNESLGSINDMNEAVQKIYTGAEDTVKISKSTEDIAKNGNLEAEKAIHKINQLEVTQSEISQTINQLGELSTNIELIVDLIKNIAGQTNLLALNAAIEAARAGEHGKGFAVVADEVKKLANQSAQATEKITEMIKDIQRMTQVAVTTMDNGIKEVKESVEIVDKVGQSLEEILEASKNTSKHIQEISNEVENLSEDSSKIAKMMETISTIAQQTASNAEEISSITEETAAGTEEISSVTEETAASAEEISSVTEETSASLEEITKSSQVLATVAEKLTKQVAVFKI